MQGMEKEHLLVVDDDDEIRALLQDYLEKNGFRVSTAADGAAMRRVLAADPVKLVVLDVMLPGEDGLALCRALRAESEIPVVMLTALNDETDRIVGLELGADDYVTKPFSPRELLARIRVILRRTRHTPVTTEPRLSHFSGWQLQHAGRQLISPDGLAIPLSLAEYRLLKVLLEHANRVLSRDQLLDYTRGREAVPFDRSVDMLVSRLRQRLSDDPRNPALIRTVRNEGYMLCSAVQLER
ncbi:two-component system response regulator BfmR [Chitiniphilus shinanonensis]